MEQTNKQVPFVCSIFMPIFQATVNQQLSQNNSAYLKIPTQNQNDDTVNTNNNLFN